MPVQKPLAIAGRVRAGVDHGPGVQTSFSLSGILIFISVLRNGECKTKIAPGAISLRFDPGQFSVSLDIAPEV